MLLQPSAKEFRSCVASLIVQDVENQSTIHLYTMPLGKVSPHPGQI
jgi:hypothetical protein